MEVPSTDESPFGPWELESKNEYRPFFLKTEDHIAPMVKRQDYTVF